MNKLKLTFSCQSCGTLYPKWTGQCTGCGEWNTIIEEMRSSQAASKHYAGVTSSVTSISDINLQESARFSSGLSELDRVLGGGVIMGSATLLGGDPGIGKSTLLLQAIAHLAKTAKVLYVTGEESLQQIALRARRLHIPEKSLWLLAETLIENILQHVEKEQPNILVIDSIQTMHTAQLASAPGSVGQVRESAMQLVHVAKRTEMALFLVGHVTKDGNLAGPRVLEHLVDTVLYFEGEQDSRFRIIRTVKNRFGAVNELGIFAMSEQGLREVNQPSAIFLSRYEQPVPGSIITATKEGTRPMLVEVQALVDQSYAQQPRRISMGLDHQRIAMILAILSRHTGITTYNMDVFINVVGGLQITETSADLPAIFAMLSSLHNRPLPSDLIVFGEVGLAGEIRPVAGGTERLKEAAKHGFRNAIIPKSNLPKEDLGLKISPLLTIKDAIQAFKEL